MHVKKLSKVKRAESAIGDLERLVGITSVFGFSLKAPEDKVLLTAEEETT